MKQRYHNSPEEVSMMNTNQLRDHFLVDTSWMEMVSTSFIHIMNSSSSVD